MTLKKEDVIEFFNSLVLEEQEKLLISLIKAKKKQPYVIKFKLDLPSLSKMGKVAEYCTKNNIPYKPRKVGERIHLEFPSLEERNITLIGGMIVS